MQLNIPLPLLSKKPGAFLIIKRTLPNTFKIVFSLKVDDRFAIFSCYYYYFIKWLKYPFEVSAQRATSHPLMIQTNKFSSFKFGHPLAETLLSKLQCANAIVRLGQLSIDRFYIAKQVTSINFIWLILFNIKV